MPDPLGPLFDALESINTELTSFATRLARLEDASATRASAKTSDGASADAGARTPGAPVVWHTMPDEQRQAAWEAFTAWVIRMADTFELTTEQLPHHCWWEHASVVAELTALWTGWESAHSAEGDAAAGPYLWHDAWSRGIDRISRMWLSECTNGYHHPKSRTLWGTDPTYRKKITTAGPPRAGAKPPGAEPPETTT